MVVSSASTAAAEAGGFAWCGGSSCDAEAHRDHSGGGSNSGGKRECFLYPLELVLGTEVYDRLGNLVGVVDGSGRWFNKVCNSDAEPFGLTEIVFVRDREASPNALKQQALEHLTLPLLSPRTSPVGMTYVNLDTWLWIDAAQWQPVSATAAVPGVSVTVTASPVRVVWEMGDGTDPILCVGPGKPYTPHEVPPCAHVYRRSSAQQPDETYQVKATVQWEVSWSVTGAAGGGALAPTAATSTPFSLRVGEIQTERPAGG